MNSAERQPIQPAAFEPLDPGAATPKQRWSPARWALIAALVAFAIALWFLLTARSLEIVVVAEEKASVRLSGLSLDLGDRFLARPGSYELSVDATGYEPYVGEIDVSRDASQRQEVILQALPGLLTVETTPEGAEVAIDGTAVGTTPLQDFPVASGTRLLTITAERYHGHEQSIEITGREVKQRLPISLDPAWADVEIISVPEGASILVDGEALGSTPATVEILEGNRTLTLTKPGFADWSTAVIAEAGVAQSLTDIALLPATGVLSLNSVPAAANVSVDGEFAGQTPIEVELTPNEDHRISVSIAGYRRASETIRMEAGSTAERNINLRPLLGDVVVRVEPEQAEIWLNGTKVGTGSQTLSLPAIQQRLEFRLDGYESTKRSVTPRPGLEQLVEARLLTPEAAREARLTPTITTALGQTLQLMDPQSSPRNEFSMGASRRDPGRRANEVLHPVRLERRSTSGPKEVTNAQFACSRPRIIPVRSRATALTVSINPSPR